MAKKKIKRQQPIKRKSPPRRPLYEIKGLLLIAVSLLLLLSLASFTDGNAETNWLGLLGYIMSWLSLYVFGVGSYIIALSLGWIGWRLLCNNPIEQKGIKVFYFVIFLSSTCILSSLASETTPQIGKHIGKFVYSEKISSFLPFSHNYVRYNFGGVPSYYIYRDIPAMNLRHILSNIGTGIIFSTMFIASFLLLTRIPITAPFHLLVKLMPPWRRNRDLNEKPRRFWPFIYSIPSRLWSIMPTLHRPSCKPLSSLSNPLSRKTEINVQTASTEELIPETTVNKDKKPTTPTASKKTVVARQRPAIEGDYSSYRLPPQNILTNIPQIDQSSIKKDLRYQAEVLEETLLSFGIEAKVGKINCGPTIISFEVHPAVGVKVQRIKSLENDIALNLQAHSIRIIAPIPGKAAVGIEIPNPQPQNVSLRGMLANYQRQQRKLQIPLLIGKTVSGENVIYDLTKMPHLIIAGATGSGKSVCINGIIMSILMNARPDEIKLMMIDPKKVELTPYNNLPHMIAPIITEPQGACEALRWLTREMEYRYEVFKQMGVRNITSFNSRKINSNLEEALDINIPKKMHYIVLIIDEMADLIIMSGNDIEMPLARLAQMARAVGIHVILATQRPSREIITGLIKANFPTRIGFKVSSRINSQIILDEVGAETLLGNGDMLLIPPGTSSIIRAQGAYVSDEDINKTISFISRQADSNYLIKSFETLASDTVAGSTSHRDDLYEKAQGIIKITGSASTTFLQRKLKIGYARAASLIDELEENGIVGPADGSKPRKVFIK